jgi:hypothetical protein
MAPRTAIMDERLDQLLERLAATPAERSLNFLEFEVGRAISKQRGSAQTASALAPVRIASIGLALAMGVTVGGVTAATAIVAPRPAGAFSMAANLAPSTLLEDGR